MVFVLLLLAAPEDGWEVARKTERTLIERRPRSDGLMEMRATTMTDVPAAAIAHIFWYPRKRNYEGVKKRIVLKHDDKEKIVYQQLRVPVVKDRDYTVRVERYADPQNGLYQFSVKCDSSLGPAENEEHVRVKECQSLTTVETMPDGRTHVSYVAFANPAGKLPHWIVNMLAPKAAADVLELLIDDAREPAEKAENP